MTLHKTLVLFSVLLGVIGSLYLSKSVLVMSPKAMLSLTAPYSRMTYAPEQIDSMSEQKAYALVGILLIFFAVTIQLITIFIDGEMLAFSSLWSGFWSVLIVVSLFSLASNFFAVRLHKFYRIEVGKLAIKEYCIGDDEGQNNVSNLKSLEVMVKELINFKRLEGETDSQFLKRLSKEIRWAIPLKGSEVQK